MRFRKADNPFRPGYGTIPPELAGRDAITAGFEREIRRLRNREPETESIALIGPRGCGKTTLIFWLKRRAAEASLQVVDLKPDRLSSLAALAEGLSEPSGGLAGGIRFGGTVPTGFGDLGASAGLGGSGGRADHPGILDLLVSRAGRKPLILVVDEAHELDHDIARTLFNGFQSAANEQPMLLVYAGTPDTGDHLRGARVTFVERGTSHNVGRLDDESSYLALAKPLLAGGVDFDDAVVRRAASEAQNYPYFLQCWGEALWNAVPERKPIRSGDPGWDWFANLLPHKPRLGQAEFDAAKVEATRLCQTLYEQRVKEIRRYGFTALAAELALEIADGKDSEHAVGSFSLNLANRWKKTGSSPPREFPTENLSESAEQLLLHTGFVWKPKPYVWEFGIPSLASHVVKSASSGIAATLAQEQGLSAFRSVLQFAGTSARTHEDVVGHLVDSGAVFDEEHAERIMQPLELRGLLGPVGRRAPNGGHLLRVLTPRLARVAIEEMKRIPDLAITPTPYDDLTP